MYLTASEYETYTGETAPSDFAACLALAESIIDGPTLQYYAQLTDLTTIPAKVLAWIKQAVAYQVQAISQSGGIAGATEPKAQSASLGKYSYGRTGSNDATQILCVPAASLLPYLVSYARGMMA